MKKFIQHIQAKALLAFASLLLISAIQVTPVRAQNEDSCKAFMLIMPDNNNPLLMHFFFTGTVPVNSFSFLGAWDFGDGFTSGDSCPDHLYSQPGTYIVCLSFNICIGGGLSCDDDTCESITIGSIAGIQNHDGALHQFYSYPNPVQSSLFVRSDSDNEFALRIKDVTGHIVFSDMVKNDDPIDVSAFANGIYFIEAGDGNPALQRKMLIQR